MDFVHAVGDTWKGIVKRYELDLAFGDSDENDFELTIPERFAYDVDGSMIETGDYVFFPHTEWGGIVDGVTYDTTGDYPTLTYEGRTWHGMLSTKVIRPDDGEDYYTVSGSVQTILGTLIDRLDLSDTFTATAGDGASIGSYSFDRYTDAYTGICKMLSQNNLRLNVTKGLGKCELSAVAIRDISDGVDDNYLSYELYTARPVNHLICLGEGDLAERTVIDLYMDGEGNVSETQTFFGEDEICEAYDYSNAEDEDELVSGGTERLQEYYEDASSIDAEIPDYIDAHVGDYVTAKSVKVPLSITATISTITVSAENGKDPELAYKVGSIKTL